MPNYCKMLSKNFTCFKGNMIGTRMSLALVTPRRIGNCATQSPNSKQSLTHHHLNRPRIHNLSPIVQRDVIVREWRVNFIAHADLRREA